jgi:hypothetical protein
MTFIQAIPSHLIEYTATLGLSFESTASIREVAKEFFQSVFLHPEKHVAAIVILCAVPIVVIVGIVFLVKKAYERFCKERIDI